MYIILYLAMYAIHTQTICAFKNCLNTSVIDIHYIRTYFITLSVLSYNRIPRLLQLDIVFVDECMSPYKHIRNYLHFRCENKNPKRRREIWLQNNKFSALIDSKLNLANCVLPFLLLFFRYLSLLLAFIHFF